MLYYIFTTLLVYAASTALLAGAEPTPTIVSPMELLQELEGKGSLFRPVAGDPTQLKKIFPIKSFFGGSRETAPGKQVTTQRGTTYSTILYRTSTAPLLPQTSSSWNIYLIYYGNNWASNPALMPFLTKFVNNLGQSPWMGVAKNYFAYAGQTTPSSVTFNVQTAVVAAGSVAGVTSTTLSDSNVLTIIKSQIPSSLPNDPKGLYLLLTSSDINQSEGGNQAFCTSYCGWHSYSGPDKLVYGWIGNPDRSSNCLSGCAAQNPGPNYPINITPGADGMTSVIAHEIMEAITDPQLNAWYSSRGAENGDICAWGFGTPTPTSPGATVYYNMKVSNTPYLIQQMFTLSASSRSSTRRGGSVTIVGRGYCAMQ